MFLFTFNALGFHITFIFTEDSEQFNDIADYIKKLGSQKWEDIRQEPERLTDTMKQLTEETQELAFTNYKTFVETADISRTIMKDLGKSKESLAKFMETMPNFIKEFENFSLIAGNIVKERRYDNKKIKK